MKTKEKENKNYFPNFQSSRKKFNFINAFDLPTHIIMVHYFF